MADRNYTLVPFHAAEGLTLKQAAEVAGKKERTAAAKSNTPSNTPPGP